MSLKADNIFIKYINKLISENKISINEDAFETDITLSINATILIDFYFESGVSGDMHEQNSFYGKYFVFPEDARKGDIVTINYNKVNNKYHVINKKYKYMDNIVFTTFAKSEIFKNKFVIKKTKDIQYKENVRIIPELTVKADYYTFKVDFNNNDFVNMFDKGKSLYTKFNNLVKRVIILIHMGFDNYLYIFLNDNIIKTDMLMKTFYNYFAYDKHNSKLIELFKNDEPLPKKKLEYVGISEDNLKLEENMIITIDHDSTEKNKFIVNHINVADEENIFKEILTNKELSEKIKRFYGKYTRESLLQRYKFSRVYADSKNTYRIKGFKHYSWCNITKCTKKYIEYINSLSDEEIIKLYVYRELYDLFQEQNRQKFEYK